MIGLTLIPDTSLEELDENESNDPETAASFFVFGQLGILLDPNIGGEEKNERIIQKRREIILM